MREGQLRSGFAGKAWETHKFGGTSVANAECILSVAKIVEEQLGITDSSISGSHKSELHLAIVVSAMGGKPKVTDLLLDTVEAASRRDDAKVDHAMKLIREKHCQCLKILFDKEEQERLLQVIEKDLHDIADILKTVALMKWQAKRISELVSGYGELWSAQILSALLSRRARERRSNDHAFVYLDARRVITIDEDAIQDGTVCWETSADKLQQVYNEERAKLEKNSDLHFVITGYVATNTQGVATTLQRDGSDYSAAIMGKLLSAMDITIWTDVDGVLSADPRRVPNAYVLPEVSYNEAMELAYFGAKVIHPKTMQPAISADPQIPIYIRNTFNASFRGSRIFISNTTPNMDHEKCVRGFSSIENMALINVEGSGLIGVHGVAQRMFGTLEKLGINVVLISQASSEHSITFATREEQAVAAQDAIEEEFRRELDANRISNIDLKVPCSIIAAVGDDMFYTMGVSGRFFTALGDAKINVLAIAQGCSERNISAVVNTSESSRALRAVHAAFRLSNTVVRIGVIGLNEVGDSLLKLLEEQRDKLRLAFEVDLQVCVVLGDGMTTEFCCLKHDCNGGTDSITFSAYNEATGVDLSAGTNIPKKAETAIAVAGGLSEFKSRLISKECAHHVIFDCTADDSVGEYHAEWLNANIHVVTANSAGLSGPKWQRDAIAKAEKKQGRHSAQYLREVTVGGGLPIIGTIRSLLNSGDKIRRVDGILSVSLSYIMFRISPPPGVAKCSQFDEEFTKGAFSGDLSMSPSSHRKSSVGSECSFSQAVKEAIALGLMEEDPVRDLDNEYTARQAMILANELKMDRSFTVKDIKANSDQFLDGAKDFEAISAEIDQKMQERVAAAVSKGCVLRHLFTVDVKLQTLDIKIVEVPHNHFFAVTPPSCGCVRFFTQRHERYPLIVQGPAAGADSTASALLAEVLGLMQTKVGAKSGALSRVDSGAILL